MIALCHLALASLLLATDGLDTVLLNDGGRLVGTVVEESTTGGVSIQLPDGQLRQVAPSQVFRIEYRDGTFGVLGSAPPAARATPPAYPPPTPYPPPPPPQGQPVYPAQPVPQAGPPPTAPSPFMFAFGAGLAVPSGNAEIGVAMQDVFQPQGLLELEAGLRFTPQVMGSLVLDLGFGGAAKPAYDRCRFYGGDDCSTYSARIGLQLRYAFTPLAPSTAWLSLGTGAEVSSVSYFASTSTGDLTYSGWEVLRFGGGVDFRTTPSWGWGLFAMASVGSFSEVDDGGVRTTLGGSPDHAWFQVGVRMILNP